MFAGRGFDVVNLHIPVGLGHDRHISRAAPRTLAHDAARQIHSRAPIAVDAHHQQLPIDIGADSALFHMGEQGPPHAQQQAASNESSAQQPPALESCQTAASNACPQVQFGVFTNLAKGSAFMGPAKMSRAAQDAMAKFAPGDLPEAPMQQDAQSNHQQPSTFKTQQAQQDHRTTAPSADACPLVQCGVFTNLATGSHFARPATLSSDAVKRMKEFAQEQSVEAPLKRQSNHVRQHQSMHPTELAASAAKISAAAGSAAATSSSIAHTRESCPQVQFGVFTNLKSGAMFAPPSKLSKKAKERADNIFPNGALDLPGAAGDKAQITQQQKQKQQQQQLGLQTRQAAADSAPSAEFQPKETAEMAFAHCARQHESAEPQQLLGQATHQAEQQKEKNEAGVFKPGTQHQAAGGQGEEDLPSGTFQKASESAQTNTEAAAGMSAFGTRLHVQATVIDRPQRDISQAHTSTMTCLSGILFPANSFTIRYNNHKTNNHKTKIMFVECTTIVAGSAAFEEGLTAQQPRQLASKTPRLGTALSRLSKLAKLSPGMSPRQAALQLPQPPAAAPAVSLLAGTTRASAEDHPQGKAIVSVGGSLSELVLADQAGRVNYTDHLSQQAQHAQDTARLLGDGPVEGVAACIAGTGHASRLSQAGTAMLLLQCCVGRRAQHMHLCCMLCLSDCCCCHSPHCHAAWALG